MGKAAKAVTIIVLVILVLGVIFFYDKLPEEKVLKEKISESAGKLSDSVKSPIPEKKSGCEPSYPDVCIPVYPPDLDCDEIEFSDFRVSGTDPHGFDSDKDGIGCE
ncbi:MAG TPA: hypothetical protein VLC72_00425 [Nitrosopumilaceae archaeon]|nr:hypothetical protein [Nitrosopumilaceae archaeon]